MVVKITPSQGLGTVNAPPSKSMAHRALLAAGLSDGGTVRDLAYSKDVEATLACLRSLGASVEQHDDVVHIGGVDVSAIPEGAILPCNESGSTLRFLLPLCMLADKPITLTGSCRLFERPLSVYEDIAGAQGISWEKEVNSLTVCGRLKSGEYVVPGDVSSQFITGLLYALPLLDGDSRLVVTGRFESASYVDLTISALAAFGVTISRDDNVFTIRGGQHPRGYDYTVEGDCSNAAFLDGLNLLGGNVKVSGLTAETLQGDRVYRDMYQLLRDGHREFDLSDCPDLGPVMFAMAAAKGGATFTGTARLRIKESDRSAAMATELAKFSIQTEIEEDRVIIHPGILKVPSEPLCGHNDHRIVMSLALLCTLVGGEICGAEAVSKSYPDFFEVLKSLQIRLSMYET